jgi:hypothetical protein
VRRERGFVAIEWVAAVTLLLLPAVVLVGTLPTWAERRHAATVAAREAARELEQSWPDLDPQRAELIARYVALDHGIQESDVAVRVRNVSSQPGDQLQVEVEIRMPAVSIPGLTRAGAWTYTALASVRVDDYRSR